MDNKTRISATKAFMRELLQEILSEDTQLSEDLKKWFKQDWVRIDSQGNIAGSCGTSKDTSNPDRCLPKAKAQSLSTAQRKATAAKKKKGKGQFVPNTKKAKVTSETNDPQDGKAAPHGSGYNEVNEYIDFDLRMFATQGDLFELMVKAEMAGRLDKFYEEIQSKLRGAAQEAADYFYSFIKSNRDSLMEGDNEPTNPALWSRAKSAAKQKYDVYPSALANAWAAKWYKEKGGNWRKKKKANEEVDHKPMNPGILSKDSSLKGEDGKIKISKVRAALSGMKDKNSTKAKALRRFINYHD